MNRFTTPPIGRAGPRLLALAIAAWPIGGLGAASAPVPPASGWSFAHWSKTRTRFTLTVQRVPQRPLPGSRAMDALDP
jgi:hypothetical protein